MKKNKTGNKTVTKAYRLVIFIITLGLFFIIWSERGSLASLSRLGYAGVFFINFITNASIILPFPGTASAFVAGSIWNPALVGIFAGVGAALGELFGYFLGYSGSTLLEKYKRENKYLKNAELFLRKHTFFSIFVFAAIPNPFFDFVGILAGFLNYSIVKFLLATIMGRVLRDMIIAFSGAKIL